MGPYIPWKEQYSVGDASIDTQHKQILAIISELNAAIEGGRAYEVVEELLERMVLYTLNHFKHEEQLMQACGFPDIENHKILHDKMRRRTEGLHANAGLMTSNDLMRFLREWWINHIRGEDQCYVPYLSAHRRSHPSVAPTQPVRPIDGFGQPTAY
jgi:hemerythrin-like metal-binding protein